MKKIIQEWLYTETTKYQHPTLRIDPGPFQHFRIERRSRINPRDALTSGSDLIIITKRFALVSLLLHG
jgi:hypothetical protein